MTKHIYQGKVLYFDRLKGTGYIHEEQPGGQKHPRGVDHAQPGDHPKQHQPDDRQGVRDPRDPEGSRRADAGGQTEQSVAPVDFDVLPGVDDVESCNPARHRSH